MTDQHKPGPALNAAVARAIGWPYREWKDKRGRECCAWEPTTGGTIAPGLWRPSTDIADAMRAAAEWRQQEAERRSLHFDIGCHEAAATFGPAGMKKRGFVVHGGKDELRALCLAICRAVVEAGTPKEDKR